MNYVGNGEKVVLFFIRFKIIFIVGNRRPFNVRVPVYNRKTL